MTHVVRNLSVHSEKFERWLGKDEIDRISLAMSGDGKDRPRWYGPPIGVGNVPGKVYATADGDFIGKIDGGDFMSLLERQWARTERVLKRWERRQKLKLHTGFSSLSDLISEATAGAKMRHFQFQKVGQTGVVAATNSLWAVGNLPPAGANGSAAPGGRAPTDATTGGFPFTNPTNPDTQHFVSGFPLATVAANTLLLYDRIFDVAKTMNSTATEAVSGTPSRYQSTTQTDADYIGGNFLFVECTTVLPATAHNWTVCTYVDQANSASTMPSLTGNSSNIVGRIDHPTGQWFAPLEAGDTGIKALTQIQCSAAVATGAINFVIGHPIAFLPCPVANMVCVADGINSAFNLTRIFDDACLAFLEIIKPATTATTYSGCFKTVAG